MHSYASEMYVRAATLLAFTRDTTTFLVRFTHTHTHTHKNSAPTASDKKQITPVN
jgi:hypothetical protein